jgi:hypothetical protein
VFNFTDILSSQSKASVSLLYAVILLWSVFWKGLALWNASRNKQKYWFSVLLVVNTIGVLEILYLGFFKRDKNGVKKTQKKKK